MNLAARPKTTVTKQLLKTQNLPTLQSLHPGLTSTLGTGCLGTRGCHHLVHSTVDTHERLPALPEVHGEQKGMSWWRCCVSLPWPMLLHPSLPVTAFPSITATKNQKGTSGQFLKLFKRSWSTFLTVHKPVWVFDSTNVGVMPTVFAVFFPLVVSPLLHIDISVQEGQCQVSKHPGNAVPPTVSCVAPALSRQCWAGCFSVVIAATILKSWGASISPAGTSGGKWRSMERLELSQVQL